MSLVTLFMILLFSVLTIASSAIGIQCIGKDTSKSSNKGFLIFMLIVAIFGVLGSIGMAIMASRPSDPTY